MLSPRGYLESSCYSTCFDCSIDVSKCFLAKADLSIYFVGSDVDTTATEPVSFLCGLPIGSAFVILT